MKGENKHPSAAARGVAARAWTTPKTENIIMMPELAEEFARIIDTYREALIWCSGSGDFQYEGKARKGWEGICKPLL